MDRNFRFDSEVQLLVDGQRLDLHNDYHAVGAHVSFVDCSVSLSWRPIASDRGGLVLLAFSKVTFLQMKGFDVDVPRKEDQRLEFMGWLHPDNDTMEGFLPESAWEQGDRAIFVFGGGLAVKIGAAKGWVTVGQ